jgi:hypothetical protein
MFRLIEPSSGENHSTGTFSELFFNIDYQFFNID